jgi:hypothetical protein
VDDVQEMAVGLVVAITHAAAEDVHVDVRIV